MIQVKTTWGREELTIQTGKMAKQADGAVTVQYGGTMVLVTCVCARQAAEKADFFPLTVEYQEKTFAAGRIPGGYFKREGRPSEKAILTARMIDRPIRPLFPDGMRNDVQVIATVLSLDDKNDSDILALIGASAALTISDIPFEGPIGVARVGELDGNFILNPTFKETETSSMDLVVVAKEKDVVMLEAGANQVSETRMMEAIKFGHEALKPVIALQEELRKKVGKAKREDITYIKLDEELYQRIKGKVKGRLGEIFVMPEKQKRMEAIDLLEKELIDEEKAAGKEDPELAIKTALSAIEKDLVREIILNKKKRVDGRAFDEIRNISSEINLLPRTHGSALFTRGETQALAVTTLGTGQDEQIVDALEGESTKTFMLHYNFPPFSVGEAKPMRGPGRREIGHGALAAKALERVIPAPEEFPYTIRIVSEILESNGSSSMATVCSSSMSLMAAGVPVKSAVAGIALGLFKDEKGYAILTDIAGVEDHYGDMDFKVAGTKSGVTALQLDIKIKGVGYNILEDGFGKARQARLKILERMTEAIAEPSKELSPNAPRIVVLMIDTDKIREVIGPGGKIIRKIIAETGADINIEDDGSCQVASADKESLDKALKMIKDIVAEPEVGQTYKGEITKIMAFGAFCEFLPGKEGLIHVSEISTGYVKDVASVLKEGQEVEVLLFEKDSQGRYNLSMKRLQEDYKKKEEEKKS